MCDYDNEWLITFNAKKSNIIYTGKLYNDNIRTIYIDEVKFNVINEIKYLGTILTKLTKATSIII